MAPPPKTDSKTDSNKPAETEKPALKVPKMMVIEEECEEPHVNVSFENRSQDATHDANIFCTVKETVKETTTQTSGLYEEAIPTVTARPRAPGPQSWLPNQREDPENNPLAVGFERNAIEEMKRAGTQAVTAIQNFLLVISKRDAEKQQYGQYGHDIYGGITTSTSITQQPPRLCSPTYRGYSQQPVQHAGSVWMPVVSGGYGSSGIAGGYGGTSTIYASAAPAPFSLPMMPAVLGQPTPVSSNGQPVWGFQAQQPSQTLRGQQH